jgi:DNA-binding FadR family transcriptional regulator
MNNLANATDHQETMAELRARLEQLAMRYSASRNTASEADNNLHYEILLPDSKH